MRLLADAAHWISDRSHYIGRNSITTRLWEHVTISAMVVLLAAAVGIPLGFLIGHTGKGRTLVIVATSAARALPTLGLLTILALTLGIGLRAPLLALFFLALPSVLSGAYAGFDAVDRTVIDAARAVGMTEMQIVGRIELPLGLPLLLGGLRAASLQVIATVTLADYVGAGGLGHFIFLGLKTRDYTQMLAGSILVMVLAIASEIAFGLTERLAQPAGIQTSD